VDRMVDAQSRVVLQLLKIKVDKCFVLRPGKPLMDGQYGCHQEFLMSMSGDLLFSKACTCVLYILKM